MANIIKFPKNISMGAFMNSSAQDQAQDLVYDAWDAATPSASKKLAKQALLIDPLCTDAFNVLADCERELSVCAQHYINAIDAFKKTHDKSFFKQNKGVFWGLFETRPYMRAIAGYAAILEQQCDIAGAIALYQEALDLNPNDNQGLRYSILNCFLSVGEFDKAKKLLKQYNDESSTQFEYGRLYIQMTSGSDAQIRAAYKKAVACNAHVVGYILRENKLPKHLPPHYGLGSDDEAVTYLLMGGYELWRRSGLLVLKHLKTLNDE